MGYGGWKERRKRGGETEEDGEKQRETEGETEKETDTERQTDRGEMFKKQEIRMRDSIPRDILKRTGRYKDRDINFHGKGARNC